ncbi:MAG: EAL domain-containing protein [Zoogloeaceae bacterium]|nr:EAL domain-containing protein [Zoogloeaceae bacterium]
MPIAGNHTVLNVSSDREVLGFSSRVLRDAGFHVIEVADLAKLPAVDCHPDLILMDTRLGKEGRCAFCHYQQSARSSSPIPVLHLVPDSSDLFDADECQHHFPGGSIGWPAGAMALLTAVHGLIERPSHDALAEEQDPSALIDRVYHLSAVANCEVDGQGTVLRWSKAAERLHGWPAEEVLGQPLPIVDAASRPEFMALLSSVMRGQSFYSWPILCRTRSGLSLPVLISMAPLHGTAELSARVELVATDITEIRALRNERAQLSAVLEACDDFVCLMDVEGRLRYVNASGRRQLGLGVAEPVAGHQLIEYLREDSAQWLLSQGLEEVQQHGQSLSEQHLIRTDGSELPVSFRLLKLSAGISGHDLAVIARDIRAQKSAESSLRRLGRTYEVFGKCSQALLTVSDEAELLQSICDLLTGVGGYRLALITRKLDDPEKTLEALAWSGDTQLTVEELHLSWGENSARGRGPTGIAVRTGEMAVRHDLRSESPEYLPWRELNARLGLCTMAAIPLQIGDECYGALSIYSSQPDVFALEEVCLLREMTVQLGIGIQSLRVSRARKAAERQLNLFAGAIASTSDGVMITDAVAPAHPIVYVNPAFTRITGYSAEEALGKSGRFLLAGELAQPAIEDIRHALRNRAAGDAILRCYRRNGDVFWNELHVSPIHDDTGTLTHYVSVISDVSQRVAYENQLAHLAMHDPLTGLANRSLLSDRLQQALVRAERDATLLAVLIVDLDHFKEVNDSAGHRVGDLLLQAVSQRLSATLREGDTLARLGGDEFAIVLSELTDEHDASMVGSKILAALAAPFHLDGTSVSVTLSIGASLYPAHGLDALTLMRFADQAMYQVKETGRNGFLCYSPQLAARTRHQDVLLEDLRQALPRGELSLHYQPKVDLYSGELAGVEVLIRWCHPVRGMVPPDQFIPLAERNGLIIEIGEWVLREACRQAGRWQAAGLPPLRVAVNLSAPQLQQGNLVELVARALLDNQLDANWLELELTESVLMENLESATKVLGHLKKLGVRLAMDDFGTGYSSLGYLRQFPFDVLKIDRSFVQNITTEPGDAVIAVAVIAMAHSLGLQVIAEGVETESQMLYLRTHLCDEMQGFLFSKPLAADAATDFLLNPPRLFSVANSPERAERTLLLVDDEPDTLKALKRLLRRAGYRILSTTSPLDALELLARHEVQVIVSDQRMPEMTGAELLSRVKVLYPQTIRIVLSGYTELNALTDAINRGAIYRFITKPWDDDELREAIREAFVFSEKRAQEGSGKSPERDRVRGEKR